MAHFVVKSLFAILKYDLSILRFSKGIFLKLIPKTLVFQWPHPDENGKIQPLDKLTTTERVAHLVSHAALGCLTGAVASGDCGSGVVGGVVGELTGEILQKRIEDRVKAALLDPNLTQADAAKLVESLRAEGVNVARLAAGLSAAVVGGNVDTAADAGGNAAENNAFFVPVLLIVAAALEAVDKVLVAKDAIEVTTAAYACNGGDVAACTRAQELAKEMAIGAGIELTIGAVIPGSKAAADLLTWVKRHVDPATLKAIERVVPNRTVRVADARPGTPEYDLLNNPPANTRVALDNGTTFKTGQGGYVDEVTYQPVNNPGMRDTRQTSVGKEGIAGDVGGHIQACRHGGTCDRFNLFPQNSNFNNSAYKKWENEITRSLQNGDDVGNVTVRLNRADPYNPRPDSVRIEYQINGETRVRNFKNEAGG